MMKEDKRVSDGISYLRLKRRKEEIDKELLAYEAQNNIGSTYRS